MGAGMQAWSVGVVAALAVGRQSPGAPVAGLATGLARVARGLETLPGTHPGSFDLAGALFVRLGVADLAVAADDLERLARARWLAGDPEEAWRLCTLADLVDESLDALAKAHPGLALLPSKADPKVKRWQRVSAVNASDTPGNAPGRVAAEEDWKDRHRQRLRELQATLDEHVEQATGRKEKVVHRRGVGAYQGSTEATSLSEYPDRSGRVFERGLAACAAVGLKYRQKEVFLSRIFANADEKRARRFAREHGLDEPTAVLEVRVEGRPADVLRRMTTYGSGHDMPGVTALAAREGGVRLRFYLFDPEDPAVAGLLDDLAEAHDIPEARLGWAVGQRSGDSDDLEEALDRHRDNLRVAGYGRDEIAELEARHGQLPEDPRRGEGSQG